MERVFRRSCFNRLAQALLLLMTGALSACTGQTTLKFEHKQAGVGGSESPMGQSFEKNVYPKLKQHCATCHSVKTPQIPTDFASSNLTTAYTEAKRYLNFVDPNQSPLIIRPSNNHCSPVPANPNPNCNLDPNVFGPPVRDWIQAEIDFESSGLAVASTLRRSSALTLSERLKLLFPNFDPREILDGVGLGQSLGRADFNVLYNSVLSTSPLAVSHLRSRVAELCSKNEKVFSDRNVLMPGETLPEGISTRQAFTGARNVWGFPYKATDAEVLALAALYSQIGGEDANNPIARQALCMATLLAPQFWYGNPGKLDVIRRMALDLGNRFPTLQEFASFESGELSVEEFMDTLANEAGYRHTVSEWHRNWLGTKDFNKYYATNGDLKQFLGTHTGDDNHRMPASGAVSQGVRLRALAGTDLKELVLLRQQENSTAFYADSEKCDGPLDQTFDPITTKIEWQVRHPTDGNWNTVGSWVLDQIAARPRWVHTAGLVRPTPDTSVQTNLDDLTWAEEIPGISPKKWKYKSDDSARSRLAGTPFEEFTSENRRVLRYGSNGQLQNGYSKITLWWSGQEVYVCNTGMRILASCAYRPLTTQHTKVEGGHENTAPYFKYYSYASPNPQADWTRLAKPEILRGFITDMHTWVKDSIYHPTVLESFSCGRPNPSVLGSDANPTLAQERLAFPKTAPYNTLAFNVRGPWYGDYSNDWFNNPEGQTLKKIYDDLTQEPMRLVEHILQGQRDYRELLTSDYTLGSRGLQLLYHTQGHWLPTYPPGLNLPQAGNRDDIIEIRSSSIASLPKNWFRNATHSAPEDLFSIPFASTETTLSPRTFSGILTMPAFLAQSGAKARSLSARIFRALTCNDLNGFTPNEEQHAIHLKYVPNKEPGGANHVSQSSCLGCHINLDPLASAMSSGFLSIRSPDVTLLGDIAGGRLEGETQPYAYHHASEGLTLGMRSRSDQISHGGALLGTEITQGVRQVGTVLANSRVFAKCSVTKAFEGLFGRAPATIEEENLVNQTTDKFQSSLNYNYTQMVKELVISPAYQREN